jgi:hypothetical protein
LVDLTVGQLETYRDPARRRYGRSAVLGRGDSASPQAFPEVTFSVADLLG